MGIWYNAPAGSKGSPLPRAVATGSLWEKIRARLRRGLKPSVTVTLLVSPSPRRRSIRSVCPFSTAIFYHQGLREYFWHDQRTAQFRSLKTGEAIDDQLFEDYI